MSVSKSYYSDASHNTLEKFILAEDVEFEEFTNVVGKFYFNAMTPTDDKSEPKEEVTSTGHTKTNYIELIIPSHLLMSFVEPTTKRLKAEDGKYYNFMIADSTEYVIPKDTIFVVEMIGGSMEIEKMSIVGIYMSPDSIEEDEEEEE